jgi:hypothetical protein
MEECVASRFQTVLCLLAIALAAGLLPAPAYAGLSGRSETAVPASAATPGAGAPPRQKESAHDAIATRESLKQTLIRKLGLATLILFFPPGYPTNVPAQNVTPPPPPPLDLTLPPPPPPDVTPPPPPPPGDGDHNPPPGNPGDPVGGGGGPPPADNPEPATLITGLFGSSLLGLFALWRRQKCGPRWLSTDR